MKTFFRWFNALIVTLSETPFHWLYSHQVMVLRFNGRRSGHPYTIPVSYLLKEGLGRRRILCMTDVSGLWWKNLIDAQSIEITLRGRREQVAVRVVSDDESLIADALNGFCCKSRISAFFAGVGFNNGQPIEADLVEAAKGHVLVELSQ